MRHRVKGKILGREKASRAALLRALTTSFVIYEKVRTTEAKAKAVQPIIEKYITVAKKGDLAARRQLLKFFYLEGAVKKLLEDVAPRYKTRSGGYTRIIKIGPRQGDAAKMAQIELV